MVKRPQAFKASEATRLLKAAFAAGMRDPQIEMDKDRKIIVRSGQGESAAPQANPWDKLLPDAASK
jgi:hypothetical protein